MRDTGPYSTSGSRTDTRFLQHRVSQFGLIAAALFGFLLLLQLGVGTARGNLDIFIEPAPHFLLLAVLVFFGIWAFTRGEVRSFRYVRNVEGWGLILGSAALIAMGAYIPHEFNPESVMILALTEGFFARAIFVPSTAKRTLLLGAGIGIALVVSVYLGDLGYARKGSHAHAAAAHLGVCSRPIPALPPQVTPHHYLSATWLGPTYPNKHAPHNLSVTSPRPQGRRRPHLKIHAPGHGCNNGPPYPRPYAAIRL